MANQTVSITPADTTDPTLLYRALSRITEVIDELKGYRGEDTSAAKSELAALLADASKLKADLAELAREFDFKLNQQTPKSIQDLADQVDDVDGRVVALTTSRPVMGLAVTLVGTGGGNPTTSNAFNVGAVTRLSTGSYRVILAATQIAGRPVLANALLSIQLSIAGSTFCKSTVQVQNANTLDVSIHQLVLDSTPALTSAAYDITSSDRVDIVALLYPQ